MRILLLVHAFNSLSQRLFVELADQGYEVSVEFDIHEAVTREALELFKPDLILGSFLKRAVPADICERYRVWIVHPGPPGDRGPSSLDWAILEGEKEWGVTVLEATPVLDGGDVWASASFPLRDASKSSLYRREVTDAAVRAVFEALKNLEKPGFRPCAISSFGAGPEGLWRPSMPAGARRIDWSQDSTKTVLRKVRSGDSRPGAVSEIAGRLYHLYGVSPAENGKTGAPGTCVARAQDAICIATVDGAIWITDLKPKCEKGSNPAVKVSAPQLIAGPGVEEPSVEVRYREEGGVGHLLFDFYNGAMSTGDCLRLGQAVRDALSRPTEVLVLWGGEEFWSNGIDLCAIEAALSPADESLANIEAMNDLVELILACTDKITIAAVRGNAAAGGVFLALACDWVMARERVVLNPHYKNMGNLYGSEYWTYSFPKRVGAHGVKVLMDPRLPVSARRAHVHGMIDEVVAGTEEDFYMRVHEFVRRLEDQGELGDFLASKNQWRREDEAERPLREYRAHELSIMKRCFFGVDQSYHVARHHFVHKICHGRTPLHLARHRRAKGGK